MVRAKRRTLGGASYEVRGERQGRGLYCNFSIHRAAKRSGKEQRCVAAESAPSRHATSGRRLHRPLASSRGSVAARNPPCRRPRRVLRRGALPTRWQSEILKMGLAPLLCCPRPCMSLSLSRSEPPPSCLFAQSYGRSHRARQSGGSQCQKTPFVAVMPSFIPPPPPPRQHCLRCSPAHAPPQGGHLFFGVCAKAKKKQGRAGVGGARGCVEQLTPPSDASPDGSCNNKWKKGQKENKNMRFNPAGICSLARRGNDDDELSLQCVHHAYNVRHVLLTRAAVDHLQSPLGLRSHACCREPHRDKERPAHDPVRALG